MKPYKYYFAPVLHFRADLLVGVVLVVLRELDVGVHAGVVQDRLVGVDVFHHLPEGLLDAQAEVLARKHAPCKQELVFLWNIK